MESGCLVGNPVGDISVGAGSMGVATNRSDGRVSRVGRDRRIVV